MREFTTTTHTTHAYLAVPEDGSGPGVLVLHAWWGLTNTFKHICDRLAQAGFIALAPDLYHGKTTTSIDEAKQLASSMNVDETAQTLHASINYLLQQPGIQGQAVGAIGFSLGGNLTLELKDKVAARVTFYGTADSEEITGPAAILGHFAEDDDFEPLPLVQQLEDAIRASGKHVSFFVYPDTRHWFFEDNRPEYNKQAANLAWERTITFLHDRLDESIQ